MKNKTFIILFFFSFLSFYIFNSEKCFEVRRFFLIDNMIKVLKYTDNFFYDIKISKPGLMEHRYHIKKERIELFSKCIL